MNKQTLLAGGAILATALSPASAMAQKQPKPTKYCVPKKVGFKARGTLVSENLKQTKGEDTAKRRDDRYSGTITVDVNKANHRAPKGEQTYTLVDDKVRFHPRKDTDPAPGDRVKVFGKLTRVSGKRCTNKGVISQTVRKVVIKQKKSKKG